MEHSSNRYNLPDYQAERNLTHYSEYLQQRLFRNFVILKCVLKLIDNYVIIMTAV
jgi:hypothetical protein